MRMMPLHVAVTDGRRKVVDPHLLSVTLTNRGRDDLTADAFDRAKPILLRPNGTSLIKVVRCVPEDLPASIVDGELQLAPALLKQASSWEVDVLASGPLAWEYVPGGESRLAVLKADHLARASCTFAKPPKLGVPNWIWFAAAAAVGLGGSLATGTTLSHLTSPQWAGLVVLAVGVSGVLMYLDGRR